jgi:hypothetical protein
MPLLTRCQSASSGHTPVDQGGPTPDIAAAATCLSSVTWTDSQEVGIEFELASTNPDVRLPIAAGDSLLAQVDAQLQLPTSLHPHVIGAPGLRMPTLRGVTVPSAQGPDAGATSDPDREMMPSYTPVVTGAFRVRLHRDGTVSDVAVEVTSFDPALDTAVMTALRKLDRSASVSRLLERLDRDDETLTLMLSTIIGPPPEQVPSPNQVAERLYKRIATLRFPGVTLDRRPTPAEPLRLTIPDDLKRRSDRFVNLDYTIGTDGAVILSTVLVNGDAQLGMVLRDQLSEWRYIPVSIDSCAVPFHMTQIVPVQ